MLSGGGDKQFSRQMSKKETVKAINLSKQISDTNITLTAVLSSRRGRGSACTPSSPSNPLLEEAEEMAVDPES